MKKLAYILVLVPMLAGGWMIQDRATFNREAWIADYQQLRTATEQSYANLRWSRDSKQVDLVALNTTTLEQLQQATSNSAARRALANFISGFRDGHFRLESVPPKPVAAVMSLFESDVAPQIDLDMESAAACSALGYSNTSHDLAVDGAQRLGGTTFAAGTVRTPGGRTFGVIRIPLFQQREYLAICEVSWQHYRSARNSVCGEDCQNEFNGVVNHALAQALADDARALMRAGAEAVVVDLTGNGGGTEWAEYAAAALAARPLREPDVAFIRGPHWINSFNDEIRTLDERLAQAPRAEEKALIERARANAVAMRDSAQAACALSGIWRDRNAQPRCWNVVVAARDVLPREDLKFVRPFNDAVYIMTDANTASASEQFAGILQDNGVAKTMGAATMGVGCGFTNGGNPTTLKHSKLVVWMPDCARLRADGSNQFDGIKSDIPVDWGADQASKSAALLATLDKLPKH
jgi:hypothetical protein